MTQDKISSDGRNDWSVDIVEFSVVLVVNPNDPSILNPDFLRYNGIVDDSIQVQGDTITTPAFSQVTFEGGLTVKAVPDRVIFEQAGEALTLEDIVCPNMAKQYVEKVPHVPYRAVGINPKGIRSLHDKSPERVLWALSDKGSWTSFKDVMPEIQLKAIYRYNNRAMILDIIEAKKRGKDGSESTGLLFQANIHRDVPQANQQARIESLASILVLWKNDLEDFRALVEKFNLQRFSS